MARTPQEIFQHHAKALVAGDLDEIVADYADDSVYITPRGSLPGRQLEIRQAYVEFLAESPDATLAVPRQIFDGDVLYLEWTAEAPTVRVTDGTDTFVFSADGIRAHTLHYTTEPVSFDYWYGPARALRGALLLRSSVIQQQQRAFQVSAVTGVERRTTRENGTEGDAGPAASARPPRLPARR